VAVEGTKADEIALVLEDDIVSGRVEAGSVLRQEQLSDRFGVSRTPIREALRRLAAQGLVSFTPNRGVRVRTLSREELREAFLVRSELEGLATELAVPRMTPERLAELDAAEQRFSELTLVLREKARAGVADNALAVEWMGANYGFHDVIYAVAESPYLERLAKSARRTFVGQITWVARAELDELYARNDREHRALREAIAAGSAAGSRTLAREHVLHSWELLDSILDLVRGREPALRSA
jgi:DNA-binding GntR family transcriptional regulator